MSLEVPTAADERAVPFSHGGSELSRGGCHSRPSFFARTCGPFAIGGVRQSTFTLVQTAIGGGVLTMAYMMRLAGLVLGFGLLLVSALTCAVSMSILMKAGSRLNSPSFGQLVVMLFGPGSGVLCDLGLFLYGNFSMVAYFIFLGDFLPDIVKYFNHGSHPMWAPTDDDLRTRCLLATLIPIIPMAMAKDLSVLRYISPLAFASVFYTAVAAVVQAPSLYEQHVGKNGFGDVVLFQFDWNIFRAFSITVFAYNCHLNVVPVASALVAPSNLRIRKISFRATFSQFAFYTLIAAGGYMSFLGSTDQDLLKSYGGSNVAALCARLLLSLAIIVGIPTNVNPTVRSLYSMFRISLEEEPIQSPETCYEQTWCQSMAERMRQVSCGLFSLWNVLSISCVISEVVIAIYVPKVAIVIAYLGATMGTVMMMILPALVLYKYLAEDYPWGRRALMLSFLSCGAVFSLAGIVVMVLQAVGYIPPSP